MKNHLAFALSILAIASAAPDARAAITPAPAFSDHAVVQRDKPVPVWGKAAPGENVTVTFKGQTKKTTAGADGKWSVTLAPMPASKTPATLTIAGENTLVINDVLVGDVWLCSGQSNMAFMVSRGNDAEKEIAAGNQPLIRHLKVAVKPAAAPTDTAEGSWTVASPDTVGSFTAVGYFFAREIVRDLDVPVGLINASRGGSPVEAWTTPRTLATLPEGKDILAQRKQKEAAAAKAQKKYEAELAAWKTAEKKAQAEGKKNTVKKPKAPRAAESLSGAGGLFNGMVHPFVPCALRGFLWYQGEANSRRSGTYATLFSNMIESWREYFGQGPLPFYWVQLPNFTYTDSGDNTTERAKLREAQDKTLALPATGQAVTIDIGEVRDNHPKNKQEVGRRLALVAKAGAYGMKCEYSGPRFAGAAREGTALRIRYTHTTGGLVAKTQPPAGFEIAGADGKFHPATAVIENNGTVLLRSDAVAAPVLARYAWDDNPPASLFNGEGLPAAPFRMEK